MTPEPDRFWRAFFIAALIEAVAIGVFAAAPKPPPVVQPSVVQLKILAPAPAPVAAKPPPPVPPPPVTKPPPPVPVPPQPAPPPPVPHHAVIHHIIQHVQPPPPHVPPPAPEPLAPVTAAPPPSPITQQSVLSRYIGEVRAIIDSNLTVPQALVDNGTSSDCVLEFTLSPSGQVVSARLLTPSGIEAVNEAALDALRQSHLPAFPAGMAQTAHQFTLPIHVSGDQ
jgi:protein TonB